MPGTPVDALFEAANKGQIDAIRQLLASGIDVNARKLSGTALHEATAGDQEAAVNTLLAAGAGPNARDEFGGTPLSIAVAGKELGIVRALIAAGADVNLRNRRGETTLMLARTGEAAKMLLAAGASIDARDWRGRTALIRAVDSLQVSVIKELLAVKADINIADKDGYTALHLAAETVGARQRTEVLRLLIDAKPSLSARNEEGDTPLHVSMAVCQADFFQTLRQAGASLDLSNADDLEKFYAFAGCGRSEVLDVVLGYPDVPDRARMLSEAYFGAIGDPDIDAVDRLLTSHVAPAAVRADRDGRTNAGTITGLIYAVLAPRARPDMIRVLIKHGVPLEARDLLGRTALILAAAKPRTDMARELLAAGANPNAADDEGQTALMLAAEAGAAEEGEADMTQALLAAGAKPDARAADGRTALMIAAGAGAREIAQALLTAAADPNLQAGDGSTALMRAIDQSRQVGDSDGLDGQSAGCRGETDMVELLLRHRADPRLEDKSGKTALQWTENAVCTEKVGRGGNRKSKSSGPGPAAIIEILRRADAAAR